MVENHHLLYIMYMNPDTINLRIKALRAIMERERIAAFIIPSTDPHLSEYVAPHWESRKWISGFTGSAGTVVVTRREAGLWTDSRYFLQAAQQLEGTEIVLYKEMLPETPSIPAFLSARLKAGETAGIDGRMFSAAQAASLKEELAGAGISVKAVADPMEELWAGRPPIPDAPAFVYDIRYAGRSCEEKIGDIRKAVLKNGAKHILLTALDEIAWTLNIRGSDVHCNPVVISYLLIGQDCVHFFVEPGKVTEELAAYLRRNGIETHPYNETEHFLKQLGDTSILVDPSRANWAVCSAIAPECTVVAAPSPAGLLKAIRNGQETEGIRSAMLKDGVALVRFLKWLEEAVPGGGETEISATRKLRECRAAQPLYMGDSFDTIAGYREHGAIVHYEATPETDAPLKPEGFLLLDSGAQYLDGTTDVTRTVALGRLTEEEKTDYTLVLKGHIALAEAVFPEGTRGAQLDVLARMPMWRRRMNYLHGTGHGVGHFLNVHEGPQSIRMNENPVALRAGMVTSNEPGVYKAGSHGIRTENLMLAVPAGGGMFGGYLKFETLTLCPICTKGIVRPLLTGEEAAWLNAYHRTVCERLSPLLGADERRWLEEACREI